jgi:hypothetical protein
MYQNGAHTTGVENCPPKCFLTNAMSAGAALLHRTSRIRCDHGLIAALEREKC